MNPCKHCGNHSYDGLPIITETVFGHGDSTHTCYVECTQCKNSSEKFTGWGLFDDKTLRKAQASWNQLNPSIQS